MRFKPKSAARTPRDRDGVFARRASAAEHSPPTPVRQGDRAASLGRRADAQTLVGRADHAARHSSFQKAIMQNPPNSSGSFGFIFMNRHWPSIRRIKLADNRRGVVIGSIESASAAALGSAHAASASPSRRRPASPRIESAGAGHAASRTPHGASRESRVACRVSRVAGGASPGCAAREAHASARARRAVSAPPGSRVPEPRDIGRPHRGAPLFPPTTRMNVSTSAICPMSIGSRSSGGVRRAMPKDLDSTPAARARSDACRTGRACLRTHGFARTRARRT